MKNKLPNGWIEKEFNDLVSFEKKTKKQAGNGQETGKYKFFTSSSIQNKFIDGFDFDGERLIFSTGGSAGIHYCNDKFSCSADCFVTKNNEDILTKYLYYYFKANMYLLEWGFQGAGLKHLSKNYLLKVKIRFPKSKENQKQIVEILERAEKIKEKRKRANELSAQYLKSVFYEMFGDPFANNNKLKTVSIKEILLDTPQNGLYKPSNYYNSKGTIIIRIDSFYDGKISFRRGIKRLELTQKEKELFRLGEEDVLINRVNSLEYLGKCALVENLQEETVFESNMMRLKINKSICSPRFLNFFLCTRFIKNQILQRAKKAVNQASINQQDVQSLQILLPPLELQQRFSSIVENVEKLKERQEQSEDKINNLYHSLMQKAFVGELIK